MIFWHSMDSWTAASGRTGHAFEAVTFIGGWAAPLFLFLAGVSIPLAGARSERTRADAGATLQKRGWTVFGLAHLFRLQSFLLNPAASWSSLLKPDILNILGLGIVATAFCWSRATTPVRRVVWLLAPAAVIVLLAPGSRVWMWPEFFRAYAPRLEAYVRPVAGMGVFSVFPWLAFVFVGAFIGEWMATHGPSVDASAFQWRVAGGAVFVGAVGAVGTFLPSVNGSEFWSTSVSFFLLRVAVMMLMLGLAWFWSRASDPMVQLGRASLFVYWVHVELAYGFFSQPLHYALPLPGAIAAFGLLTLLMWWAAGLWLGRRGPWIPPILVAQQQTAEVQSLQVLT
jgi:uncharacterized membrane protein